MKPPLSNKPPPSNKRPPSVIRGRKLISDPLPTRKPPPPPPPLLPHLFFTNK